MKNLTQILALVLFTITFANAQMNIGVKTGISMNRYSFSDEVNDLYDASFLMGYTVGATLDFSFGGRMGLETGAFWTRKGSATDTETSPFSVTNGTTSTPIFIESKEKLNYLTIPAHLKYHFRGKTIGSYILAGPELNFALSGKYSFNYVDRDGVTVDGVEALMEQNGVSTSGEIDFGTGKNDNYNNFDFGFAIGGGLFYELEVGKITLDARYSMGLSNMYNTNDDDRKQKNRSLIVQVGYSFPIGGAW